MLKLKEITKTYETSGEEVKALKGIDIEFRKSEFVAILGQSGCGKTTLLNIIGGLDRYTSGDLIINGKSTKDFKDSDWDSYRNYSIGFVFQSYNLIPHQNVLANVELALTISGYSKEEKRRKAIEALESVGLGDQIHKKPSQLSGGQMQRVAIARAIVNDPDIILADEPTGALDAKTSVQIMDLLKKISKDKLIVMVTHNPDLAEKYSNRIVKLLDGKIIDDSNPYDSKEEAKKQKKEEKTKKTQMKFSTAFRLSLNNLMTKKARTMLTAFAGSIGIIGIALILSLSNGINTYIEDVQRDTMTSYPISIQAETIDLTSIMANASDMSEASSEHDNDAVYSNGSTLELASTMTTSISENNLTAFKEYLESDDCEITQYLGENGIVYSYDTKFDVYAYDPEGTLVNTDGSTFEEETTSSSSLYFGGTSVSSMISNSGNLFEQLMPNSNGESISATVTDEYDVIYGEMPDEYNEIVIVLDSNNEIATTTLYQLGLLPASEYKEILSKVNNGEEVTLETQKINYEDVCNKTFKLIPECDYYVKNTNGIYEYVGNNTAKVEGLLEEKGIELKITGIIKQKEDSETATISSTIGYTKALTDYIIEYTNNSEVVKAQESTPETNVINGLTFETTSDEEKASQAKEYISNLGVSDKAEFASAFMQSSSQAITLGETELATMVDQYLLTADQDTLISVYDTYLSAGSYDENMQAFGKVDLNTPSQIDIYADTFEDKDEISAIIDKYNETATEENQITYTDYIGLLMSSVTTIVNAISYVLIAFVSISLIVSSIMIAIITYISVLERTKEIGILRAMGTSKKDISKIFNAETFIEGLIAGLLGIGITIILNIPISAIIEALVDIPNVANLPLGGGIGLIIISVLLTVVAGLIPSKMAAKKDPAVVLRTE